MITVWSVLQNVVIFFKGSPADFWNNVLNSSHCLLGDVNWFWVEYNYLGLYIILSQQWLVDNEVLFSTNFCLYFSIFENEMAVNSYIQRNLGLNTNCIATKPTMCPLYLLYYFGKCSLYSSLVSVFCKIIMIISIM